jgi:hypothetical protein
VDVSEEEEEIGAAALPEEVGGREKRLAVTRAEMAQYRQDLGFTKGGGRP